MHAASSGLKVITAYCAAHITPLEARFMRRFCLLSRIRPLTFVFKTASRLGDWPLWAAVGLCVMLLGGPQGRLSLMAGGLAVVLSVIVFKLLKHRIGRPRPFESWEQLPCLLAPPDKFSFPSGHTMTAFAIYGAFSVLLPGVALLILPAAVLIALSRIFLGVHYPSDVLAGGLLGTAIGYGVANLFV